MARLYVAMYKPIEGNYEHWVLYLENGAEHTIYEVTGEHPSFSKNVTSGRPTSTNRHKRSIFVATVNSSDLPVLREVISGMQPDNSTVHWNCQDYVLEILEKLEEECVIDEEDDEYVTAKRNVKRHYGAQL